MMSRTKKQQLHHAYYVLSGKALVEEGNLSQEYPIHKGGQDYMVRLMAQYAANASLFVQSAESDQMAQLQGGRGYEDVQNNRRYEQRVHQEYMMRVQKLRKEKKLLKNPQIPLNLVDRSKIQSSDHQIKSNSYYPMKTCRLKNNQSFCPDRSVQKTQKILPDNFSSSFFDRDTPISSSKKKTPIPDIRQEVYHYWMDQQIRARMNYTSIKQRPDDKIQQKDDRQIYTFRQSRCKIDIKNGKKSSRGSNTEGKENKLVKTEKKLKKNCSANQGLQLFSNKKIKQANLKVQGHRRTQKNNSEGSTLKKKKNSTRSYSVVERW